MSLADQASLLFIPSGYKSQKVYSIFPTDGDGDFDFSRSGSATRIAKNGLITTVDSNVPRLEYPLIDGVVNGCPSLILEPQRTNLVTYSEDFSNGSWQKVASSTITTNTVISPDSTLNASTFKASSSSYGCILRKITTFNFVSPYTISFYVKKNNYRYVGLRLGNLIGASDSYNFFDFDTETVNNTPAPDAELSFEKLTNGWYKLSLTGTPTSSTAADLALTQSNGSTINPTGTEEVYVFGAQLEEGSFPTSYIKSNSGSTTTRSAETANNSGDASTFNDSEGVLMAEISALADDLTFKVISLSDGTGSNRLWIYYTTSSNLIQIFDGSSIMAHTLSDITTSIKILAAYDSNGTRMWINGYQVQSRPYVGFSGFDRLNFSSESLGLPFYGNTKQLQYYNTVLTDSELEQLTSWTSFTDMANGQQYSIQ